MADIDGPGAQFHYNAVGSNVPTQVTSTPARLYSIHVSQFGGSMGYLQMYNAGTGDVTGGTITPGTNVDWTVTVPSGTSGAGTPAFRDIFYPKGIEMSSGISYLWAAGSTGTVAHGVNAVVHFSYQGTR